MAVTHDEPMRRSWWAFAVGVPVVVSVAVLLHAPLRAELGHEGPTLAAVTGGASRAAMAPPPAVLTGLDLAKMTVSETGASVALAPKKTAHLTVDPVLQRVTTDVMTQYHVPEAAVVLMDVETGRILVYASHVEGAPQRDLCIEATAPAASVFKIVTGSALVETSGLTAEQRECYSGGEQKILEKDLLPDPKRDKWCTTLAGAMGRSINTVFARLALRHLKPNGLEEWAKNLGFGNTMPFDVRVQTSAIHVPDDTLGFARTSAGFWNTTLSPLHAAWLSAMIARGGEPVRPSIVHDVVDEGKNVWSATPGLAQKRVLKTETAQALTTMMDATVADGTSYKAFHDGKGQAFLGSVAVAGKTGTLTDPTSQRFYTWFTGFAPSHTIVVPDGSDHVKQVAIGVLVVNQPTWTIKANTLAREVLRAYFAQQKVPNVTTPQARVPHDAKKSDG